MYGELRDEEIYYHNNSSISICDTISICGYRYFVFIFNQHNIGVYNESYNTNQKHETNLR